MSVLSTPLLREEAPPWDAFPYRVVILDADGTMVLPASGGKFRIKGQPEDWDFIDDRRALLLGMKDRFALHTACASNQGGVAYDLYGPRAMYHELLAMCASAQIELLVVCFTHPKGTVLDLVGESDRRKPGPGMLLSIWDRFSGLYDLTDRGHYLFVGDRPEDAEAASAAGMDYLDADLFFARARTTLRRGGG